MISVVRQSSTTNATAHRNDETKSSSAPRRRHKNDNGEMQWKDKMILYHVDVFIIVLRLLRCNDFRRPSIVND